MASFMQGLQNLGQKVAGALGMKNNEPDLRFQEDYVKFVDEKFEKAKKDRLGLELQWRLNLAFLSGQQFCDINTQTNNIEEMPLLYAWEEREQFDQISPIIEVRVARLTRGRPKRKVRPASGEAGDIGAAETCAKILEAAENETDARGQLSEMVPWSETCGVVFKKEAWNFEKGRILGYTQQADEMGNPVGQPTPLYEGDIDPTIVSPFELYAENPFASFKENRYVIHAKAYPIDEIRDRWGVEVKAEDVDAFTLQPNAIGNRGLGYGQGGFRISTVKLEKHAVVKEYWERPCKKYPNGRLIIVAGGKLLYQGDLPFHVGKDNKPDIPFIPVYCIKKPGMFYGDCIVPRLIPVQRRYNALRNRKAEYLKRVAIGQLITEADSIENDEELDYNGTAPGQRIIVRKGTTIMPKYMEHGSLPADFDKEEATLLGEFRALSGVSDISKVSQAPSGMSSGIAMSIALEQDETRLSTTASNIEEAIIEEGKMWLRLYKQFAKTPRIARIASGSEVEVIDWDASDIRSDDVILEAMSGLGESPAQRRQFIFELLKTPLLMDPATGALSRDGRSKLLHLLEFGDWENAADTDYDLQVAKARRQVKAIKAGILPVPAPFDDPEIHLTELHRWMLSSEYEMMSAQNPQIQLVALQFEAELTSMLQAKLMQQMQMQSAINQQPPPKEGGQAPQGGPSPQQLQFESPELNDALATRNALLRQQ